MSAGTFSNPAAISLPDGNGSPYPSTITTTAGVSATVLDANATPIDIFTEKADLTPFSAILPTVALDNLYPPENPPRAMLRYMELTDEQNLRHADMANPRELNEIIWYSVRGEMPMPDVARLPAFELMIAGIKPDTDDHEGESEEDE